MAIFDNFPYTNLHELNTDWLVKAVKEVKDKTDLVDDAVAEAKSYADKTEELFNQLDNLYITPEKFGAVGDGVTDDTSAFKDMFNAITYTLWNCNTVEKMQHINITVLLENKIYCISETLIIPAGCSVIGKGVNNTVIKFIGANEYGITFQPIDYGEGYLVCKFNILSGFSVNGEYMLDYGISNIDNDAWMQSCKFSDLYITKCNKSGFAIVSCWLSSFMNIKSEVSAVPFIFTENSNGNGFNNNYLENICASNFTICGMLLSAANCTMENINVERAYEYCRGSLNVTSLTHNGVNYTDQCGILITKNTDTLLINGIWQEWLSDNNTVPAFIVKDINTYSGGLFKGLTVQIKNLHLGTQTPLVYKILSGIVDIDGLKADLTGVFTVIDTTGADANTTLTVDHMSRYYAVTQSIYTLPYGAVKIKCYDPNGRILDKQTTYHNLFLDDNDQENYYITTTDGLDEKHFGNTTTQHILSNGMTARINVVIAKNGSDADANGYFDLGFVLPAGYGITGVATARNEDAETAVNSTHWLQFSPLANDNLGVRMTHNNATVTLSNTGLYMFIIELYKL